MTKSVLRWAGSKRLLLPQLREYVPSHFNRYIEPFAGSACLFFSLSPKQAVLGDINAELMLAFHHIRKTPIKVFNALEALPRTEEDYYRIRACPSQDLPSFNRAIRFLYLNRNCFNGVFRLNQRGEFNVPWGQKTGNNPSVQSFRDCAAMLKRADLRVADFEEVVALAKRNDFVYLDPPYSSSVASEPGLFGSGAFGKKDVERLARCTQRLEKVGAKYLLSFEYDPNLLDVLPQAHYKIIKTRRHVAGFSGARGEIREMLFTNVKVDMP